ncbi:MAG: sugar ABC transporter permease [Anaeromyxobacter sp.]
MATSPDRNRLLWGVGLGLLVAVGGGAALLRGAHAQLDRDADTRRAIVSLGALSELAARTGDDGEKLRAAVEGWQKAQPAGTHARIVLLSGARLEASTAPGDVGDKAAPRRLSKDEKGTYDRAQRLKGSVNANREGGAVQRELEVEVGAGGSRSLASPLERDGEVAGMAELTTAPFPAQPPPSPVAALAAILGGVLAFAVAGRFVRGRWPLVATAVACFVLAALGHALAARAELARAGAAAQGRIAAQAQGAGAETAGLLQAAGVAVEPTLKPGLWDRDLMRQPRGLLTEAGALDPAGAARELAGLASGGSSTLWATAVTGLVLLAFFGLGFAAATGKALRVHRQAYAYIAPAMVGTLILVFFPFFYGIALSFTEQTLTNQSKPLVELWVGFKNYLEILGDFSIITKGADGAPVWNYLNFYWTFFFTVAWTVTNVAFGVSFGLLLALVLNTKDLALRPFYRVVLILPWAMPNYITALIWKGMFHRQFGVVNQVLAMFGVAPISWFETPFTSFLTAFATNGWLSFPFMMVVSLGALQSIPADLYEAARVDGATRWQQFKAITLPSLRPALVPAVILSVVWTFNMFNIIFLVTGGEPNGATEILITQAYKFAFQKYQYGYAAAYATVIFGILLVYGNFQNRVTRATEGI